MKKNILEYKGYHTKIELDTEEMVLRGKIEGINDLVNFESESIQEIEKEFHAAVDDYLEFCLEKYIQEIVGTLFSLIDKLIKKSVQMERTWNTVNGKSGRH